MASTVTAEDCKRTMRVCGAILALLFVLGMFVERGTFSGTDSAFVCQSTFKVLTDNSPRPVHLPDDGQDPGDENYVPSDELMTDYDRAMAECHETAVGNATTGAIFGAVPLFLFVRAARRLPDLAVQEAAAARSRETRG